MQNTESVLLQFILIALITLGARYSVLYANPQQQDLGIFEGQTDVGQVTHAGSAVFDTDTQEYTIKGSGSNMWFDHDEFHYVWKKLKGNFILRTKVHFVGKGMEDHRKLGWIVRSGLDPSSSQVSAVVHGDGLTSLQYRRVQGDSTLEIQSDIIAPGVIRLERKDDMIIMSAAQFGDTFRTKKILVPGLGNEVYVGLFVCSHNPDVTETAIFSNTRIIIPPKNNFVPYRDYLGSNLEILEIKSGRRKIIYRDTGSIQAPNWTADNKALIFNKDGSLYHFDLQTNRPTAINTGFAIKNNNDHVLSFDGTMLGISNHSKKDGDVSIIYTVPVGGGTPKKITATGPSYLHGWSPDGKTLAFVGQRNNEFDIYTVSSNGGEETRITTAPGLDDGPEYSPDGNYIYFNSVRSGSMEIWRMRPDGSNPEQLTNDKYNNWFPHVSPDGRQIVFISFPNTVDPDDHPFYKRIYIRMMAVDGGNPSVISYVFGGQGTMNVPSWSPDGTKIAFVSNTDIN